jgi:hypothetical protein
MFTDVRLRHERSRGRGYHDAAKRIDVLATCVWTGMPVDEISLLDLSYAPPFSPVFDPVLVAARATAKAL